MLGLLRPYCVGLVPGRWAKREREAEDRRQFVEVMRLLRAAARERARRCGQFSKGNSGAGAFSVVRLRGEVSRRSGRFRWGSLYGKGGGVAEKRWGSRRKG